MAKRRPSLQEGRLYLREGRRICLEGPKLGRKGRLFVLGELRCREGAETA